MLAAARCSRRSAAALLAVLPLVGACGADDNDSDVAEDPLDEIVELEEASELADRPAAATIAANATWQWQLQGDINTSYDVDVYDIDLFDAPQSVIDGLQADGRIVVCYYSAGSYEDWRDDATAYPASALGEPLDGWEGERWIDTRDREVRSIIDTRHDLAVEKRCDAVEPDNVTAFQNDSGFDLTADDQLDFNRFLAASAHERGLLIALKNDLSQIPQLVDDFDFAVNEECAEFDECEAYAPFVEAGKAVLNAEYAESFVADPDGACAIASTFGLSMLILPLDLDDTFRIACDP